MDSLPTTGESRVAPGEGRARGSLGSHTCPAGRRVPPAGLAREGRRVLAQEEMAQETRSRSSTCPADLEAPCLDNEMCCSLSCWESLPGAKLSHVE